MMSESLSTSLEVLTSEYGSFADSLQSVSSNDFLTIGLDENPNINGEDIIFRDNSTDTVVYIPYSGEYSYYNNIDNVMEVNSFTLFSAFAVGIISLMVVAFFKVSIDLFKKISK